jgi:sugar O-acyltransferase (sialic acid O-acetyltransferase NeuD family)
MAGPLGRYVESRSESIAIFGAGGFGREVLVYLDEALQASGRCVEDVAVFVVPNAPTQPTRIHGVRVVQESDFDVRLADVILGIGKPDARQRIAASLPPATRFATLIHPSAVVSRWSTLGEGTVVTPGAVVTSDVRVGRHAHLNLHATIGHDCVIGDFFTASPGVNVSGRCRIGDRVYLGTNCALRENLDVGADVTVGMGAVVVRSLLDPGVYVGVPAVRR